MIRSRFGLVLLFGSTIFLSAFLLFSIQPMFAKLILPWFGGSAAVWTTCLVFFQSALLAGYSYAWLAAKGMRPRYQAIVHVALLGAAIMLLPVEPGTRWRPVPNALDGSSGHPVGQILLVLTVVLGLPYVLLSTTGPLLQSWYARIIDGVETPTDSLPGRPYRLFALSNAGALMAMVAYPLWVEPRFPAHLQARLWSIGFVIFAILCSVTAWIAARAPADSSQNASPNEFEPVLDAPTPTRRVEWIALAAAGSMLLLATTNQLTQNVAPVPLLWILPLAIYLMTFVLSFESSRWYRRDVSLRLLAVALASVAYAISDIQLSDAIVVSIPLFCGGLFLGCMFCHGELHRLKPSPSRLTTFYLMIALGGALGAVFVGLIAPVIFAGIYELPVAMTAVAMLALWLNRDRGRAQRLLWGVVSVAMVALTLNQVRAYHRGTVELERSFYGSLRVVDSESVRTLFHGTVQHGSQFLASNLRRTPTSYYGYASGVGLALGSTSSQSGSPRRVGVIGLGAGTLAAYGRPGDVFHFYEINPQVIGIARRLFSYLSDSAARIEITLGDARLSLGVEPGAEPAEAVAQYFDVLIVDAFSGDAIPVHLLTKEAFALYLKRLEPNGILAIHISNQYLDLAPVVGQLAGQYDLPAVEIRSPRDESRRISEAVWVLMSRNRDFSSQAGIVNSGVAKRVLPARDSKLGVWTDDYNNLLQVMRWIPN